MQLRELRKELAATGGRALVVVHPFFHEDAPHCYQTHALPDRTPNGKRFLRVQQQTLQRARVPIIVFEQEAKVEETRLRLEALGKRAFVVATKPSSPIPLEGWQKVLSRFKRVGLRHAIVGGQKLFHKNRRAYEEFLETVPLGVLDNERKRLVLIEKGIAGASHSERIPWSGCVGLTLSNLLKKGFRVSLMPNAVYDPNLIPPIVHDLKKPE